MNDLSKGFSSDNAAAIDFDALCSEIRERAVTGEFDQQAYVSQDIIDKLKQLVCIVRLYRNALAVWKFRRANFVN